MAETLESALERVRLRVEELKRETKDQMRAANVLCGLIPCQPLYSDSDIEDQGSMTAIASDTYYGQDTADVIEDILRRRKLSGKGAASVADIFEAMKSGGYEFTASNDENAKRGVYISLGKNPKFHKIPNGDYGLTAWYPAIKTKAKNGNEKTPEPVTLTPADAEGGNMSEVFDFAAKEEAAGKAASEAAPEQPVKRKAPSKAAH